MNASLGDEAIEDARATADWYVDQGAYDAADAFFDDIQRSIRLLERHPHVGTPGVASNTFTAAAHIPALAGVPIGW